MRENLHQSNPPIRIVVKPRISLKSKRRGDFETGSGGVAVGDGVRDGLGEGVIVTGLGVEVAVAGGVTGRSNFWSGRMMEALFSPFDAMRSASGTS